jgi:glycoprotein-N-acetylgalactosamine 3-beta-galactosyltransferase
MIKKKLNKLVFALIIAGILIICFKIHFSRKQLNNNLIVKSILSKKNQSISRINLLCFVLTSKKTIFQRGPAVWNTWSKRCDKTMFVLNSNNFEPNTADRNFLNEINILNLKLNDESYDLMAEKALLSIQKMYELNNDNTTTRIKFNWFLLTDDDSFIYINNLRKFIQSTDSELPYTYGYNFKAVVSTGYHSGGGGVLLSNESLNRLYQSIINNKCPFKQGYGDVALGECSRISNVKIGNSTDLFGRERFHPLNAHHHYNGYFPGWLHSYAANKVKSGVDCCSLDSISFHYVNQQDMYKMNKSDNYLDFLNGKL